MSYPNTPRLQGPVPEIWGRVPQRNKNFTGREALLDRLHARISDEVQAVLPHALHGLGGVGKTQVAVEYAYRFRSEYDIVWWISADQPVLVRSSLAALAPHLGLPAASATGIEDASAAVLDALRRGEPYPRWLLIFDNADQPEDINEIVPRGPGHVLITSRNHRWQGVVDTVPVDVFSRPESVAFLGKRVARTITAEDADRLAEELGDLPLALEQAGALQAETGMSVEDYLRLLKDRTTALLSEGKPTEYPVSMSAAWSLSVAQLKEKLPEAVQLLRCCAFFGPEPIPRDVFAPPIKSDAGTGLDPDLDVLLGNPILLSRAIGQLGRYALARIDSSSRTIQVHRLVQALIRDELADVERDRVRDEVHLLLAAAAPGEADDPASWPRYYELLGHARPAEAIKSRIDAVRGFCLKIGRYLYSSGDSQSARAFLTELIDGWTEDSGPDSPHVLRAQRHLGNALRELGAYPDAYDLDRETLERTRAALGDRDVDTLLVTNSFGADLRARGEFITARDHDRSSRNLHEEVLGRSDPLTLRCANNLAIDHSLASDYPIARELLTETFIQQRQPNSGASPQEVLITWNGLARIVRLSGDYAESADLGEEAWAYGIAEVGAEHPWTLRTAKDLSIARRRAGAIEDGFELAEETHERESRIFGADNPDTLAAAMNLANALRTVDRADEGYTMAEDTTRRYPRIYGTDHPYNHGCAINLALLLRVQGELEAARDLDRRTLAGLDARLGRDHHYTLTCAVNLANDLADLDETREAMELGEDTLARLSALLGAQHPLTLAAAANLVLDLRSEGHGARAEHLALETLGTYDRVLGLEHPDVKAFLDGRRLDFDFDPPPI